MEFVAKTDVGLRRSNNEDSYFAKNIVMKYPYM